MEILGVILILCVCVLGLYFMRELVCWYFKINERVTLQKELNKLLENQTNSNGNFREGSNKD